MLSDRCNDDTCSLLASLFLQNLSHHLSVTVIQMADWFVEEDKVEGLTQGTDKRNSLLLSERHFPIC